MQVRCNIVEFVSVNVMDYLSRLRASNLSMFKLTTAPFGAVTKSHGLRFLGVVPVTPLNGRASNLGNMVIGNRANHLVTSPVVFSVRQSVNFLLVGIKRVAMFAEHLVVPHAKTLGNGWPVAVLAGHAYGLPAPRVVDGAVLLQPLVVHEAETSSGVLPSAAINVANPVFKRCHKPSMLFPISYIGKNNGKDNSLIKITGNSWAAPKFVWLGKRLQRLLAANNNTPAKGAA